MARKNDYRRPSFGMAVPTPEAKVIPRWPAPSAPSPPADDPEPPPQVWSREGDEPQFWRPVDEADDSEDQDFDDRGEGEDDEPDPGWLPRTGGRGVAPGSCLPVFFALVVLLTLLALAMTLPNAWQTTSTVPPVLYTVPAVLPAQTPGAPIETFPTVSPGLLDTEQPRPTATRALRGGPIPTPLFR